LPSQDSTHPAQPSRRSPETTWKSLCFRTSSLLRARSAGSRKSGAVSRASPEVRERCRIPRPGSRRLQRSAIRPTVVGETFKIPLSDRLAHTTLDANHRPTRLAAIMHRGDPRPAEANALPPTAPDAAPAPVRAGRGADAGDELVSEHISEQAPKPPRKAPPKPANRSVSASSLPAGELIADRYRVLSMLGEGGMGVVYRCRDLHAGRDVAVKRVIPPEGRLAADYIN